MKKDSFSQMLGKNSAVVQLIETIKTILNLFIFFTKRFHVHKKHQNAKHVLYYNSMLNGSDSKKPTILSFLD